MIFELIAVGALGAFVGFGLACFSTFNRLAVLDERCNTAWADIDAQLRHRHAVVPGLVNVTRAMAGNERDIILEVARAHTEAIGSKQRGSSRMIAETKLGDAINRLVDTAIKYPDLKASAQFRELASELRHVEEAITNARRFFNQSVGEYNAIRRGAVGTLVARYGHGATRNPFDLGVDRIVYEDNVAVKL